MSVRLSCIVLVAIFAAAIGAPARAAAPAPAPDRLQWWRDAKFGLFIHWGPISLIGNQGKEISWSRIGHPFDRQGGQTVPAAEYDQLYKRFNPTQFDADAWMRMAKAAGMRYVVFVTKHHDGFCMWDTKLTDYSMMHSPYGRDICRQIADSAHRQGLRLGWYYSTRDWHEPDYLHGDNSKYNDYYEGQIRELLSNYGKVDVLWFDHVAGQWSDWRFKQLFGMIRTLQPQILINDRAGKFVFKPHDQPPAGVAALVRGDFDTPERQIGKFKMDRAWETCLPMTDIPRSRGGGGWSYRPDGRTRSYAECLSALINCVTGDGNLLLDIGPDPSGQIDPAQVKILGKIGQWLGRYGQSIYNTRGGPYKNGAWGGSTRRGQTIYLHLLRWPEHGHLKLPALGAKVLRARALAGGDVAVEQGSDGLVLDIPAKARDQVDSVIEMDIDRPAMEIVPISIAR